MFLIWKSCYPRRWHFIWSLSPYTASVLGKLFQNGNFCREKLLTGILLIAVFSSSQCLESHSRQWSYIYISISLLYRQEVFRAPILIWVHIISFFSILAYTKKIWLGWPDTYWNILSSTSNSSSRHQFCLLARGCPGTNVIWVHIISLLSILVNTHKKLRNVIQIRHIHWLLRLRLTQVHIGLRLTRVWWSHYRKLLADQSSMLVKGSLEISWNPNTFLNLTRFIIFSWFII
jgi:hypothetical protein